MCAIPRLSSLSYTCALGLPWVWPACFSASMRAFSMAVQSFMRRGIDLPWKPTLPAISTSMISLSCSCVSLLSLLVTCSTRMVLLQLSSRASSRLWVAEGVMPFIHSCR